MKYKFFVVVFILIIFPLEVFANDYRVNVTKEDGDMYKVAGEDVVINTRYCYEYVYSEDSLLKMRGYSSELIFIDSDSRCDVKAVYESVAQTAGNYSVSVSQEDDNWYEIWGQNLYIRTSFCLSLALGEDAVLSLQSGGFGTLYIRREECPVEGVYSKMRMY